MNRMEVIFIMSLLFLHVTGKIFWTKNWVASSKKNDQIWLVLVSKEAKFGHQKL
jgi:hypothetical protein